jgi:hypothetical protein
MDNMPFEILVMIAYNFEDSEWATLPLLISPGDNHQRAPYGRPARNNWASIAILSQY